MTTTTKDAREKRLRKITLLRAVDALDKEADEFDAFTSPLTSQRDDATVRRMLREIARELKEKARKL